MGHKTRSNYAPGFSLTDEEFAAIFRKCDHEPASGWFPPICAKCNEFLEEDTSGTESKKRKDERVQRTQHPIQGKKRESRQEKRPGDGSNPPE